MTEQWTESTMVEALDWIYERVVNGIPGFDSAEEMAEDYMQGDEPLLDKINSMICWQNAKCFTSGFLSGIGGVLTIPVALPANFTTVAFILIRMIAAIAHMCGYDIKDDRVKTLVYICLAGNAAKDILEKFSIDLSTKLATQTLMNLSGAFLTGINQAVGFRLVTKFGETGLVNLVDVIPFIGGIVGGTIEGVASNTVGNVARDCFYGMEESTPPPSTSLSVIYL